MKKQKKIDRRTAILDATERLMIREGYAAVSTRRVAGEIGIPPPNVHYYFPTTDDLFIAVCRRTATQYDDRLKRALHPPQPIRELWKMHAKKTQLALGLEFMALANHRKAIRKELARQIKTNRVLQAEVLSRALANAGFDEHMVHPLSAATTLASMSRGLIMEEVLGITFGHAETRTMIEYWLRMIDLRRRALAGGAG